jgi:acetyl-CoA decarbonylase/synthase complex subunit gamma
MKITSIRKKECCPTTTHSSCCPPSAKAPEQALKKMSCSDTTATAPVSNKAPCCGPPATTTGGEISEKVPGFISWHESGAGKVPLISIILTLTDHLGACKARWALNRMNFIVPPGLYAIGAPDAAAPVVVTCNYKMTYDIIRRELQGHNVWLLVLETFGINVWCAAGKGTFGTEELVRRITLSGLAKAVNHRRLLLPILGGPGVASHEVTRRTGFAITYAAIRAADLPKFLDNGMVTTPQMRELTFSFYERLILVPVELLIGMRTAVAIALALLALGMLFGGAAAGITVSAGYLGAMLTGVVLGPLLLPWLPGRSFASKGAVIGLLWSGIWYCFADGSNWGTPATIAEFLALPAVSSFYTLNFTGCSTYTSRTGVKKEMRLSLPVIGGVIAVSIVLLIVGRFV